MFGTVVVLSLLLGACCLPALASAEVRVAYGMNAKRTDRGSGTAPVLNGMTARYDSVGDLSLTLSFFEPLAEPAALGGWEVAIYLADNVGTDQAPFCVPLLSPDNFLVTFSLGDDQTPAEVDQYGTATYRLKWTATPDRRQVVLHSVDPRLANRRLVCANADLNGPSGQYSFIGAALFSGFGPFDGNLVTTGRWHLASEVAGLNNAIGGARRDPPLGAFPRCRRSARTELRCSDRTRLRDVRGRPTLALNGRMRVSYTRTLRTRWRHDMSATLRWRRCPRSVSTVRAGRRCTVTRRWRRRTQLTGVFRSLRASRAAAPGFENTSVPSSIGRYLSARMSSP